jgi:cysteine desulfurase
LIYLDNNATTPILPEVVSAMMEDLDGIPRNPSSVTKWGREGRDKISKARRLIASYFGVQVEEVLFTSGGTESNHLLIQGFYKSRPGVILSTEIEHASALEAIKSLNAKIDYLLVDHAGSPSPSQVAKHLKEQTSYIFLSIANNETGAMIDLEEIASIAQKAHIPLLLDGVAFLGKGKISPLPEGVAGISFSGHKIHGPKGIGFVIKRKQYKIPPLFRGGHQEKEMRAGTENLAGILGLAKAIELLDEQYFNSIAYLRDSFENAVRQLIPQIEVNGSGPRVSNVSNLHFPHQDAELLLIKLEELGLLCSLGSACASGTLKPSHVLLGMGYPLQRALSSLRFSFSRLNTEEEVIKAAYLLSSLIRSLNLQEK